jgi:Two component regulator propeller.
MKPAFFICILPFFLFGNLSASKCAEWLNFPNCGFTFCIVNDGDILWIGADKGLFKFDPVSKDTLPFNKNYPCSLSFSIRCILKTSDGSMLIGGMRRLLRIKDTACIVYDTGQYSLPTCLLEDSYKNIWVGYFEGSGFPYHGGLFKFDGQNWTIYTSLNSGLHYNGITSLLEDSPGKILVGMQYLGGHGPALVEYDGQSWFELPNTSPNLSNTCMIRDAKGILYVGTSNDGVNTFDGQNWSSIKLSSLPYPSNLINCLVIDHQDNLWIGAYNGLYLHQKDGTLVVYDTSNSCLPVNYISCLGVDSQNNIWVGTSAGLTCFTGNTPLENKIPAKRQYIAGKPNPFSSFIRQYLPDNRIPKTILLHNLKGQLVAKFGNIPGNKSTLKPCNSVPGIYILQFKYENDFSKEAVVWFP